MTNGFLAFITAAAAAGWLYNKFMRTSGNNFKSSMILASSIGVLTFFIVLVILNLLPTGA